MDQKTPRQTCCWTLIFSCSFQGRTFPIQIRQHIFLRYEKLLLYLYLVSGGLLVAPIKLDEAPVKPAPALWCVQRHEHSYGAGSFDLKQNFGYWSKKSRKTDNSQHSFMLDPRALFQEFFTREPLKAFAQLLCCLPYTQQRVFMRDLCTSFNTFQFFKMHCDGQRLGPPDKSRLALVIVTSLEMIDYSYAG